MDPVVSIVLVQQMAVTALKLIAPLVEAEEHEPGAASEASGMSSGGSTELLTDSWVVSYPFAVTESGGES